MSLIEPKAQGLTPIDRMKLRAFHEFQSPGFDVRADSPNPLLSTLYNFQVNSMFGSGLQAIGNAVDDYLGGASDAADPDFNPYKLLRQQPDLLQRMPWLVEDFEDGRVLDLPNEAQFWRFAKRKGDDYYVRSRLDENGILENLGTGLIANVPELMAAGGLLKALKIKDYARGALAMMAMGSAENVATELGLEAINPDRNVDLSHALMFGAVLPIALHGSARVTAGSLSPIGRRIYGISRLARMDRALAAGVKAAEDVMPALTHLEDDMAQTLTDALATGARDLPDQMQVLLTPKTKPLVDQIKAAMAREGREFSVVEHVSQHEYDVHSAVLRLDKAFQGNRTMSTSAVGAVAETVASVLPGGKLRGSTMSTARKLYRTLFNDATLTTENVMNPTTGKLNPAAEALRYNLTFLRDVTGEEIDAALMGHFKDGGEAFEAVLSDGTAIKVGRVFGRDNFHVAVKDYLAQAVEIEDRLRQGFTYNAPAAVKRAAKVWQDYSERMLDEGELAGMLRGKRALEAANAELAELRKNPPTAAGGAQVHPSQMAEHQRAISAKAKEIREIEAGIKEARRYVSRRWLTTEIIRRRPEFVQRIRAQYDRNWQRLAPVDRELSDGMIAALPDELRNVIKRNAGDEPVTDALLRTWINRDAGVFGGNPEGIRQYEQALSKYLDDSADRVADTLTDAHKIDGVQLAIADTDVFKGRVLQIDEAEFRDFLDNNLMSILAFYDHRTGGQIAMRQALRKAEPEWAAAVKDKLGLDLEQQGYNPRLALKLLDVERREMVEDAMTLYSKTGDQKYLKLAKTLEADFKRTYTAMDQMMTVMEGVPLNRENPAHSTLWAANGRTLLRTNFVSRMGGMLMSSIPDMAGLMAFAGVEPQRLSKSMRGMIGMLPGLKVPKYGVEAYQVALDDGLSRALKLAELTDMPLEASGAATAAERLALRADRVSAEMARQTGILSGMNRWNVNQRRVAATLVQANITDGLRKLARLAGDSDEALAAVKLRREDAAILSSMGFDPASARKTLDLLYKNGKDSEGRFIRDVMTRDEWDNYKGFTAPEMHAWGDRNLTDLMTSAVNKEVRNIIVEPFAGSRPLMNAHWVGRVINQFQTFSFAFTNQFAVRMGHRTASQQAGWLASAIVLGGVADALHNHLAGRRSFEQTAELWSDPEKLPGMVYAGFERAGGTLYLSRPLAVLDRLQVGPRRLLGNDVSSMHTAQALSVTGMAAPLIDYADTVGRSVYGMSVDGVSAKELQQFRTTLPFQNMIWINGLYRATGADLYPIPSRPAFERERPPFTGPGADEP